MLYCRTPDGIGASVRLCDLSVMSSCGVLIPELRPLLFTSLIIPPADDAIESDCSDLNDVVEAGWVDAILVGITGTIDVAASSEASISITEIAGETGKTTVGNCELLELLAGAAAFR